MEATALSLLAVKGPSQTLRTSTSSFTPENPSQFRFAQAVDLRIDLGDGHGFQITDLVLDPVRELRHLQQQLLVVGEQDVRIHIGLDDNEVLPLALGGSVKSMLRV